MQSTITTRFAVHPIRTLALLIVLFSSAAHLRAAEIIPPPPERYFNDYAHVVSPAVAGDLNTQLEQFERDTSNQIRVVIYPKMQSDSDIADYTVRVAQSWHIGMKGKDNGAILFVFPQDRKMFIQVGYGLEGSLPDILCKEIIDNEIAPRFKAGDFNGGVQNGVKAMMAATRGEYNGTGKVVGNAHSIRDFLSATSCFWWLAVVGFFLFILYGQKRGWISSTSSSGVSLGSGGWSSGGGSSSSDDSSDGGFSSGGGGNFGGGGAGGSW